MEELMVTSNPAREEIRSRSGYRKIVQSCRQARCDQLEWVWADTCCINKESSTELSEAINSMFRWYKNSDRCYAYLHDVEDVTFPVHADGTKYLEWTLQELIAPTAVLFFNEQWKLLGDKKSLTSVLTEITRIPSHILIYGLESDRPSIGQIMSWAADRKTTRVEDRAYSLLGLFDVQMAMLYGEGKNAFLRLQLQIIQMSNDHSIFAWGHSKTTGRSGSVLADDPSFFRDCHDVTTMEYDEFIATVQTSTEDAQSVHPGQVWTYSVTNAGIQIWLPIRRYPDTPWLVKARLACCRSNDLSPLTINLASFKSNFYRYFGDSVSALRDEAFEFQQLYLTSRTHLKNEFMFKFDFRSDCSRGFAFHSVFPRTVAMTENTLTLSSADDCAVLLYVDTAAQACFFVVVGYCFGLDWAHEVICEKLPQEPEQYARRVYECMVKASSDYAIRMAGAWRSLSAEPRHGEIGLVKHTHIPRSIRSLRMTYRRLLQPICSSITIDIAQCAGCCAQPVWKPLSSVNTFIRSCIYCSLIFSLL
ncbi:hypothetical protein ID866_5876 [Astraeus odoratus]|nr:hypothetical protein ID866_5876 [Astraeus odoratus]